MPIPLPLIHAVVIVFLYIFIFIQKGWASITVTGKVYNLKGSVIPNVRLITTGKSTTAVDGTYTISLQPGEVHLIRYEAPNHFPMYHTFTTADAVVSNNQLTFPDVYLIPKKTGRVMLAFAGDCMIGRRFWESKVNGGEPIMVTGKELDRSKMIVTPMKPFLENADFTSVNMESSIFADPPQQHTNKSYTFYTHPKSIEAFLWAGIDYCTLGNNHIYDYNEWGINVTIEHMDKSPMHYSGAGVNEAKALTYHTVELAGKKYNYLGFVGWKGKGIPNQIAEGLKGGAAFASMDNLKRSLMAAEKTKDVTIINYHGGSEYKNCQTQETIQRVELCIDYGADLIVGHHPHVTQGFYFYKGTFIINSLGNFVFDQNRWETLNSMMVYVWMDADQFVAAEIIPIYNRQYIPHPVSGRIRNYILKKLANYSYSKKYLKSAAINIPSEQLIVEDKTVTTILLPTGSHGLIRPDNSESAVNVRKYTKNLNISLKSGEERIIALDDTPHWYIYPQTIQISDPNILYRVGRDEFILGSFEKELYGYTSVPTEFQAENAKITLTTEEAYQGIRSMKITIPKAGTSNVFMPPSARIRQLSRKPVPTTIFTYVKIPEGVELNFKVKIYQQQSSTEGYKMIDIITVKSTNNKWVPVTASFDYPAGDYDWNFGITPHIEIKSTKDYTTVYFDDFAVINWFANGKPRYKFTPRSRNHYLSVISRKDVNLDIAITQAEITPAF
ncbi:hypothetical protein TI03_00975 [Achromatium sp. WMS1]|nr:hypothetical protein TI03_00975 [Achromatium sp. WMS1]